MTAPAISILIVVLLIIFASLIYLVKSMFLPTRGRRINPYPLPRKALIVMDLQEGYSGNSPRQAATTPSSAPGLFGTVNRLIDHAEASGIEVAYIRQVFSSNLIVRLHGGRRAGRVVVDRRVRLINGNDFEKNRTDAFSSLEFEHFLIDRQVNELYLVGADAAYCVYFTALGAMSRGYGVTVIADAVVSRHPLADVFPKLQRKGIGVITSNEFITGAEKA